MLSSVGLEVMNSTNPELSWKSVTKGRRSKKSVARSLNNAVKVGNSTSPKRVGDFSGSDSDKLGEVILGQTSGKSENVPLKKRRHLLQSPSPHPWASNLRNQDSAPLRTRSSSPRLEDRMEPIYPSLSGDFSGIELLAAAASMDVDIDEVVKKGFVPENSSIQKNSDASSSATLSKQGLKNNESVNSLSNIDVPGGNVDYQENISATASQSISASPEDGTIPKVDRKYWDLNTPMDAWGEPYDELIAGDTLNDINESRNMVEMDKHFGDHVLSNSTPTTVEPANLKLEQDKSTSVPDGRICSELPHLKENLLELPSSCYSHTGRDADREKAPDAMNSIEALNCNAHMKKLNSVTASDVIISSSPSSKLCSSTSAMLKSEEKPNPVAMIHDGDCSSNMSECERTAAPGGSHTGTDEVNAHDTAASESAIDVQLKDIEVPQKTSSPGTFTPDAQPVASTDSNKQIDGASNSTMADCEQYIEVAELGSKHDLDSNLPNEESNRTIMVETCKSHNAGAQCDGSTTVGRIGRVLDGRRDSDVPQDTRADVVDGDDLTGFQEGYDSPYEDGELRGSFMYSWEDNEVENECVDYESDGRNGDGSDAADLGSEVVEGGSEVSHGTGRSLSLKFSSEGRSKGGSVKHPLKKHVVKEESDNNEIAGKVSNAGSGSTIEQCVEVAMEENGGMKRLQLHDHKDAVNVRVTHIDEYASKTVKGKLQSRIEGRSSADATDGKDVFFMQQSRSRRVAGSYPRPERDISPDRYMGRYRSAAPGERDGVHQWASWGSKRRYTPNYQGGEGRNHPRPRNKNGEFANNKIDGVDYHEPRQSNYLSKGMHRPLMRRSPAERDDNFGVGRRMPLTRGVGNYRSRGHYSQRPGRDFVEDYEPLPDEAVAPVRMQRYMSRREHSFSPSSGRQTHMTMPRRRSRSRSRTRSPPRAWHPHRERILGARRLSRSPDFRADARMERMRVPFSKPNFASDYGEGGYISPSRGRFSPQRNCRWVDERNFADNPIRRRRSPPVRVFRRTQRFDAVGSSGRLQKSDEYFRPAIRPGRFSFMGNNGGRECKFESNYDDRRRDDCGEMNHHHRVMHPDNGGNMRRFQPNISDSGGGGNDFETNDLNNEDDMLRGSTEARGDVAQMQQQQQQGEREEKKVAAASSAAAAASFKI